MPHDVGILPDRKEKECMSYNAWGITSLKPIKTDAELIIDFVGKNDHVIKDHKAKLVEISPEYFVAETRYDIPEDNLYRAEGMFSAGRLMQPFPLAGEFVNKKKTARGTYRYRFDFGGVSHYAVKYIHIKSPRKGAGRPKKGAGKNKGEK